MSVTAWRLVQPRWAERAFDGEGARRFGGRWNSPGVRMVYLGGSKSLAILEILVHLPAGLGAVEYSVFQVSIEEAWVETWTVSDLPKGWNTPMIPRATQERGDAWVRAQRRPVLRVPSVIVPEEWNYLLNPEHPQFSNCQIAAGADFSLDPRLR